MKKVLSIFVLIAILAVSLVSCASFKRYEKNLSENYGIYKISPDEMEEYDGIEDIDADDYGISEVMLAIDIAFDNNVYIFKCGSSDDAKELVEDLEEEIEAYNAYHNAEVLGVARDGRFVLYGTPHVINEALGK